METPCWALVPPASFQTAEQKRFRSTVDEVVHRLTMSLLDPNVANLQTQMSHTTLTSFRRSVQIPTIAGLNEADLQKSAGARMRENLSKHLGRNVRFVFVEFWTEDRRKGKGKGKVQMASARVAW